MTGDLMSHPLRGQTLLISGGSRGIGLATAVAAARHGARISLLAKTGRPHPKLPGTVYTAAREIEEAGGEVLAQVGDVRDEEAVAAAVEATVQRFGGIDIVVNNASAIALTGTEETPVKKFDLMQSVNVRGTWLLTTAALPHLRRSGRARVVTLSPPLNLDPRWLGAHPAYTLFKYGMTLLTLGWAAELGSESLAFSCLWPQTLIATAAVSNVVGGAERARAPEIMADAAMALLARASGEVNGATFLDIDLLQGTDLSVYGGGAEPALDIFVGEPDTVSARVPRR